MGLLFLQLQVKDGADESREKHVAFWLAGFGVDGCFRVGFGSSFGGDLRHKSVLPGI